MDDVSLFQELEALLLRPEVRASKDAVSKLLAEGFVEFGSSGRIYDRDQVIDGLVQESSALPAVRTAYDFSVRPLSDVAVLVTYRVSRRMPDGEEFQTLRSSIWQLIGDQWQMVFHQGTPANLAPAAP